ncbi:LLM class F420-dependent oxidoreductase [Mycobacteroides chelonae]|jgi:probable F420-dependent oxidoreductase|uniref:LLM class F420-dependent oxidoreductase n=1 Tax=Mycobacteroides chelonae TaxID=1774 RepID=A0AB73LEJ1_MYCCH|nr:LLM class F420-dependent oxidoreductase [Mycobacteroides chelonae]MBF9326976.1 LLM class F420-dependent oxidoreductase [Mycobacteroides chelonae]MBF9421153.1 LLM class F420-dependent oxidoreductase [Mycobacteroides chelonae]MBF9436656.1 LLM class F420-dependent oxidoreductase [Mycobacteroides chelonae]MBV6361055.1 LLM class F420-dependent oxidoreductase [Mycobacteroides chelonae]MEC4833437.1 LLM class F420-dependent oxidoreductase [Mycobacteroides chelonae]
MTDTQIGIVLPQTGVAPGELLTFAREVESLGYRHLLGYDHVVGADPVVHEGWGGAYDVDNTFHEPLTTFAYLAGVTALELITSVLILPQRQTVLVAKQAAQVDLLSGGRLTVGVGVGWNQVEYEALGVDFADRGKRLDEQIELLRRLWTERSVSFSGRFHTVTGAGLAPLPSRSIPVFVGGSSPAALRRAGQTADGWFPLQWLAVRSEPAPAAFRDMPPVEEALAAIAKAAREAGRDRSDIEIHSQARYFGDPQEVFDQVEAWRGHGATRVSVNTLGAEFTTAEEHLAALADIAQQLGLSDRSTTTAKTKEPSS